MLKTVLFQAIQFSISTQSKYQKQFYFKQLSINAHFSSICAIDRTLSGTTTPAQSGSGSDGNEELLHIPQSFNITGISSSDDLMSYPGHSLRCGSYPSAERESVYSTAPADLANKHIDSFD